ncbi:uncharacterized protein [Euwallacea similis]|uniref:uncharacterized protein n=1 Tax=Euwallacea similis TaxID=1736056 RepID=UPI00344B0AF6
MNKIRVCAFHLIALVEARPVLWDKTIHTYKNKAQTKASWEEICRELFDDYDTLSDQNKAEYSKLVTKKWWNIRDGYVRTLRRERESIAGVSEGKKYVYSNRLQFLSKSLTDDSASDNDSQLFFKNEDSQHTTVKAPEESRHLCFFKGILPSLERLNDDDTIEFQIRVLQLVAELKRRDKGQAETFKAESTSSENI